MPPVYDSLIDRSDVGALIPEDVSRSIIQGLPASSVALTSFRRATMSRAQQRLPVLSVLPVAYWVDGDTGLKQTTEQHWANQYLDARELAVIVPIPQAVLDDVDFDIWVEVRPRLVEAFGVKIDAAAIFGTDKPAGWPDSIVEAAVAAGNVVEVGESTGDIAADVNLVMGKVEEDGFDVSGFWARRALKAAFWGLRDANGQPIFQPSLTAGTPRTLHGESILYPTNGAWDATAAELIAGDVSAAILAVRQDISYRSSPRPSSATPRARSSSTSPSRTRWRCGRSCGSPSRSPTPSASRPPPRPRASASRSWRRPATDRTPMALLTVAQLREHVETSLPDAALERILASCEQAVATWAGPLEVDDDGVVGDVTERVWGPGRPLLRLHQLPTAIVSVTDVHDGIETLLDPSGYRLEGRHLRRLGIAWGEWTTVVYAPTDDSAGRRTVLVLLCQLELNVQPGMAAQGAGPWSETYGAYLRQRNELLRAIRPADPPAPRAVPYSTVEVA